MRRQDIGRSSEMIHVGSLVEVWAPSTGVQALAITHEPAAACRAARRMDAAAVYKVRCLHSRNFTKVWQN